MIKRIKYIEPAISTGKNPYSRCSRIVAVQEVLSRGAINISQIIAT
ncbi:MAG: hypothetical protein IPH57_18870 [Saprospiraceae bacterium]|nr:hypothetical protein [Saprospiraceae bacterium]